MARRNQGSVARGRALTLARLCGALVALVLLATPNLANGAPLTRQFGGPTSQTSVAGPLHITLDVDTSKVSDVTFSAAVLKGASSCALNSADGASFVFSTGAFAIVNHHIAGKLKDDFGDTVVLHAHVSRSTVVGSFIVFTPQSSAGAGPCNSGVVRFTALSGSAPTGSTAYSGTVGPGWLITFDVSPHSTAVENLVVAYDETCNGTPSDVTPTYRFGTLTITSGEFTGTTTSSFGPTVSDTVRIDGTFSGGVAAGQVSDTSRVATFPTCTQSSPFVATASS